MMMMMSTFTSRISIILNAEDGNYHNKQTAVRIHTNMIQHSGVCLHLTLAASLAMTVGLVSKICTRPSSSVTAHR